MTGGSPARAYSTAGASDTACHPLLTITDCVEGSTAAVLMHHSRTACGKRSMLFGSGVGPAMVKISFITGCPLDDRCGSVCVAFGSSTAILFTPTPPSEPA